MRAIHFLTLASASAAAVVEAPAQAARAHAYPQRQVTSAAPPTTTSATPIILGYSSVAESSGSTLWVATSYFTSYSTLTTSSDYFGSCYFRYDTTASRYDTSSSTCYLYTTCSGAYLMAASTSSLCIANSNYACFSTLLYSSWGASDPRTKLGCISKTSKDTPETVSIFQKKPDDRVSVSTTQSGSVTPAANPNSTPTAPTPAATTSAAASPPPSAPNNAGVIAGSVVGGLAVIAIAIVAILYILRRGRHTDNNEPPSTYMSYAPGKPPAHMQDLPEYNPHASALYSAGSASPPHMHSPMPHYADGYQRSEMAGVTSPVHYPPPGSAPATSTSGH